MRNILLLLLCSMPCYSFGIVVRHDVSDSQYIVDVIPEYLIDMPHEGHGVLIEERWILTVAHEIFYGYEGKELEISGNTYTIESVLIHPDYSEPPDEFYLIIAKI